MEKAKQAQDKLINYYYNKPDDLEDWINNNKPRLKKFYILMIVTVPFFMFEVVSSDSNAPIVLKIAMLSLGLVALYSCVFQAIYVYRNRDMIGIKEYTLYQKMFKIKIIKREIQKFKTKWGVELYGTTTKKNVNKVSVKEIHTIRKINGIYYFHFKSIFTFLPFTTVMYALPESFEGGEVGLNNLLTKLRKYMVEEERLILTDIAGELLEQEIAESRKRSVKIKVLGCIFLIQIWPLFIGLLIPFFALS